MNPGDCPICGHSLTSADGCHRAPKPRPKRDPAARCYVCRERAQKCECPGGPDLD